MRGPFFFDDKEGLRKYFLVLVKKHHSFFCSRFKTPAPLMGRLMALVLNSCSCFGDSSTFIF